MSPLAAMLYDRPLCVVDVETTGLDPAVHTVVEVAAIRVDPHTLEEIETFQSLVKSTPYDVIDPAAMAIHKIPPADLAVAPDLFDVLPQFARVADGCVLAGHNVGFDAAFLRAAYRRCLIPFPNVDYHSLDTASLVWPLVYAHKLNSVSMRVLTLTLGLDEKLTHRALGDARRCLQLIRRVLKGEIK